MGISRCPAPSLAPKPQPLIPPATQTLKSHIWQIRTPPYPPGAASRGSLGWRPPRYLRYTGPICIGVLLCCVAPCFALVSLRWGGTSIETRTQDHVTGIFLQGSPTNPRLSKIRRKTERTLCKNSVKKISRGGPLLKHLPQTRASTHNYQTRNAIITKQNWKITP